MDQVNLQGHGQQKMRPATAAPRKYDGQQGNPLYDPANGGHYGTSMQLQPVHSPLTACANTILQAHPQLYVFLHLYSSPEFPVADIWSRLPRKTKLQTRSSSPVPGRMYAPNAQTPTAPGVSVANTCR